MVQKSILTPVLSGVLAVLVVGSGAFYFIGQKDKKSDDSDSSSQGDTKSIVQKADEVKDSVNEKVETIEKAISGELDFAYNASVTFTPGDYMKEMTGLNDTASSALGSFGITASAKQKGEQSEITFGALYNDKQVISADLVGDRSSDNIYVQVPELSSSYMSINGQQVKDYMEKAFSSPLTTYIQRSQDAQQAYEDGTSERAATPAELSDLPDFKEIINAFNDVDQAALEEDIKSYAKTAADNFPEAKDNGTVSGEVDGVKYELSDKAYEITLDDYKKIATAVLEDMKDDSTISTILGNESVSSAFNISVEKYQSLIDEAIEKYNSIEDNDKAMNFDIYFDADNNPAGFYLKGENDDHLKAVVAQVGDDLVIDVDFVDGDDHTYTIKGAVKNEDNKLNGTVNAQFNNSDDEVKMSYTLTDVVADDSTLAGTIEFAATVDGKDMSMKLVSDSTADKIDLGFSATLDSKSLFDIAMLFESTDASDITVPSDAIAIDLENGTGVQDYAATIDIAGFKNHIEDTLGEDVFNAMFGASNYIIDDSINGSTPAIGAVDD